MARTRTKKPVGKSSGVKKQAPKKAAQSAPRPPLPPQNEALNELRAEIEACKVELASEQAKNEELRKQHEKESTRLARQEKSAISRAETKEQKNREAIRRLIDDRKFVEEEIKTMRNLMEIQHDVDMMSELCRHYQLRTDRVRRLQLGEGQSPWLECEFCGEEYGEALERSPRILKCGHTICLACARRYVRGTEVKCPIDLSLTDISDRTIEGLPKNFVVLSMIQ